MATVFISGVSRGIGLGLAARYLEAGDRVFGSVRADSAATNDLAERYADQLTLVRMDVADAASVDRVAAEVGGHAAAVDTVVCNAAVNPEPVGSRRPLEEIPDEELLDTFAVNVVGQLRTVRAFLPLLRASNEAKVAFISSGAGSIERCLDGGMFPYRVSKASLNMLARLIGHLVDEDGIGVLAVSPGWVRTDMGGPAATRTIEEASAEVVQVIAAHTLGSPLFVDPKGKPIPW